jgi:RNA-directed DNA polymerase
MVSKLKAIKVELQRRMHDRNADVGAWLRKVVLGYYQYHAVPGNTTQLRIFKLRVCRLWQSVLVRRSQGKDVLGTFYPSPEPVDSSTPSSAPLS